VGLESHEGTLSCPARSAEAGRVGGMVKVGDKAPEIELLDQDGNEFSLAKSLAANKVLHLVYFYPSGSTPG